MVEEPASIALPALNFRSYDYRKTSAKVYYLLGLIAHDRTEDALKVAKEFGRESNSYFPTTAVREMERAGFTPQLNNFFREVLKQDPELPFWEEYVRLAAHAGKTAEMVELVRTTSESSSLSANQRLRLQALLHRALLADNKIEDGVAELRKLIQASAKFPYVESLSTELNTGALAVNLAEIGYLLNRTNWIEEGVAAAKEAVPEEKERELIWGDSTTVSLAKLLTKLNRSAEAEAVLGSALERSLKSANAPRSFNSSSSTVQILGALVRLYHQSGRNSDVLYLFDNAANWGVKDLKDLPAGVLEDDDLPPHVTNRSAAKPIGYYAAAALAKTGRNDEARNILDATLNSSPGCDRLYELLLELEGDHALAKLDEIFARDQFEERPLIWKAHWLRMHDRLEDAEQAARKAIAIDPSDGEEGAGDRLRAYAELTTIRAARGDQKEAAFLRGAVEAIRESERADQFYAAGLLLRAISMYEASLTHFADAYCIHARLAVQLSELGKHEEAAEHYRKAYELMPVSFGRVESHCFGCEQAFDGFRAQSVAEKVFGELIQKTPNNPQVHYLFGYLREEQSRYGEAMEHYQAAVKLDPDYLNAWLKIFKIGEQSRISSADRDEAVFNILRLDPRQRHGSVSFERVTDLKTLWEKVAEAHAKIPVKPLTLYPLSASKAELEKRLHLSAEAERSAYLNYQYTVASFAGTTPAAAIAQNKFIQAAQQMIDRSRSLGMEF
jgi:tetratricopeptide (TPR) repeat protein